MCTRFNSSDSSSRASRTSKDLFDYVFQQRQAFRQQQQQPQPQQQQQQQNQQQEAPTLSAAWSDDDDKLAMDNNQRGHLKRSMSRRGAIGFACVFTTSCIETANYFYDNPSDDSFVPIQKPPERTGSSAKKRCRLGRAESSGSHQRHLDDATDQFAAVAISGVPADDTETDDMERSVRRKMHMEEFSSSQHTIHSGGNLDEATAPGITIDTAGHYPVNHLLQKQPSFWSLESDMQRSSSDDSTMTMDDL